MTVRRPRNEPTAGLDTNARLGMTNVRRILRHKSRGLYGNLIADPAVGFDDIIQEGLLAAWDARLTWNPAAGRTLVDWMAAKGYYQMLETVRRSKVHAHRHPALTRVQDQAVDDRGLDDIDDAAEIVTITGEVRAATRRLTDRHVALLQGHFDGRHPGRAGRRARRLQPARVPSAAPCARADPRTCPARAVGRLSGAACGWTTCESRPFCRRRHRRVCRRLCCGARRVRPDSPDPVWSAMTAPTPIPPKPAPSPLSRWYRTLIQVAGALVIAIPAEAASFGISAEKATKYAGMLAGLVAVVSGVHNAINAKTNNSTGG